MIINSSIEPGGLIAGRDTDGWGWATVVFGVREFLKAALRMLGTMGTTSQH